MKRQSKFSNHTQSVKKTCPKCSASILPEAMNIQEGVALCPQCGSLTRLSQLVETDESLPEIVDNPPQGCDVQHDGRTVWIGASLRSVGGFVGAGLFAVFWNSITGLFLLHAIAGLYSNLVGPLPEWYPSPDMDNGRPNMNGEPMTMGTTLFLCVFLTPFVLVGSVMIVVAIVSLLGKIHVVIQEDGSYVATGIGFLRWKKHFDASQVREVEITEDDSQSRSRSNATKSSQIKIHGSETIKFGSMLNEQRLEWLRCTLQELLVNNGGRSRTLPKLPWVKR